MSHMSSFTGAGSGCAGGGCSGGPRLVAYAATGVEAPGGFTVPIGATLADANYRVSFYTVEDDITVPIAWSFPTASKTTTQFEARFAGDALSAAGTYYFEIVET